jgi:hypothetical protein
MCQPDAGADMPSIDANNRTPLEAIHEAPPRCRARACGLVKIRSVVFVFSLLLYKPKVE